jgi:hypothetical protein
MAFVKDPAESKRYGFDWTAHLEDGDSVTTSTWVVADGLTGTEGELVGNVAAIRLSGGTEGTEYRVTNNVVTTQGDIFERSFTVNVQQL